MADERTNRDAFRIQQRSCEAKAAPIYGRMCAALADGLTRDSGVGARVRCAGGGLPDGAMVTV